MLRYGLVEYVYLSVCLQTLYITCTTYTQTEMLPSSVCMRVCMCLCVCSVYPASPVDSAHDHFSTEGVAQHRLS